MKIPKLEIGELVAKIPIVQRAMGVYVSRAPLPNAVIKQGGIGTVSSIWFRGSATDNHAGLSQDALIQEIRKCREGVDDPLAVNIMGVLSNAVELVKTAVAEKVRMIVYGAGIPTYLPSHVEDPGVALVPIVSSARVVRLILANWDRKFERMPGALILEGPLAGGHLGFSAEQLADPENFCLEKILPEVLKVIEPYQQKYGKRIPVIAAGGIHTGQDIAQMLRLGAAGVQMATRFVVTKECTASNAFKQMYLNCTESDLRIIHSPVGMLGRAISNPFLASLNGGDGSEVVCPFYCLTACKREQAPYCIAKALLLAYKGNVSNGLVFAGAKAHLLKQTTTVENLFKELLDGLQSEGFTL